MRSLQHQRGAAALSLTVLLVFALTLVVAWTQRHVVAEARASAASLRSQQAFEAAEAGVEWALARLNDDVAVDSQCRPSSTPGDRSFRDTRLRRDGPLGRLVAVSWHDGTTDVPLLAACGRGVSGWRCSCPAGSAPAIALDGAGATTPAFNVRIEAGGAPGVLRVTAHGCLRADAACAATTDDPHDASARVEIQVALLPALRQGPVAALTAGGDVDFGAAPLRIENRDGVALAIGGRLLADAATLVAPAGSDPGDSIAAGDAALAALDADRFFARWFGMSRRAWIDQPASQRIDCSRDCTARIARAIAAGARSIAIDGDVDLRGALRIGSPNRPVVIVATGDARFRGDVVVDGAVYAASLDWRDATAAATIRGALLVHGSVSGDAPVSIVRDPAVVSALRREVGSIVRVDGSWKDF